MARAPRPSDPASGPASALRPRRAHPHLYQINTWPWLDALSAAAGHTIRLADVPDAEWDRLARLGFDCVYLLGIWKRSIVGRSMFRTDPAGFARFDHALPGWTVESVVGSPFSIADYSPDPRIGSWADLDRVRASLHARGIRLIVDFVPNHTGPDHPWINAHPDYYMQGSEADFHRDPAAFLLIEPTGTPPFYVARGRDPYFAPWADTAQLDYFNPATRAAMLAVLQEIGRHVDGLRCDMSMLVLNGVFARTWAPLLRGRSAPEGEFWTSAIAALPSDFLWLAEVYWGMEGDLQSLGFGFTYDKLLYDRLKGDAAGVVALLRDDASRQGRMARFLENHDEERSVTAYGRERQTALMVLIATLPGLRFFHQGQFEGLSVHLPMPLNAALVEAADTALVAQYEQLLGLVDDPVFHDGEWKLLDVTPDSDASHGTLLCWRWQHRDAYRLVVVNLGSHQAQGRVWIAHDLAPGPQHVDLIDCLDGQVYRREHDDLATNGLYLRLDGNRAHLFSVTV